MSFTNRTGAFSLALAIVACGLPLVAQTSSNCNQPVTGFLIEHPIDLASLKSTLPQTISSDVTSQLAGGAKEVRSRTAYNMATRILTNDLLLVNKGSPNPTPSSINITQSRFAFTVVYVEKVLQSCKPTPSVVVTGYVADGSPLYGDPSGAPYAFSFSYATRPPSSNPFANPGFPQFRDIVIANGGVSLAYQDRAAGSIDLLGPTVPGGPSIVLNIPSGGGPVPVFNSPFQLDASYSSDPGGGLVFEWASDKPVGFYPGNFSPVPLVSFQSGAGDYNLTLTVTNSAGVKATSKFKITYNPK
jgi:hypothetical protein